MPSAFSASRSGSSIVATGSSSRTASAAAPLSARYVPSCVVTPACAIAAGIAHAGLTTQLGTYLAESGAAAEAVRLLEPVATMDEPDLDALNALGIAYARAGRSGDARR